MHGNTPHYDYYSRGWELPLLKLCEWQYIRSSPMGLRILSAIDLLNIGIDKQCLVLDLGCGVGTTSILISRKRPAAQFYCIDISQTQIAAGKKYVDNLKLSKRFSFIVADVTTDFLKVGEGIFDFVIATEIIEHLENPQPLLRSAYRLGRTDAVYVFSVPIGKENSPLKYRIVNADGTSYVTDDLENIASTAKIFEFYHKTYKRREIVNLLEQSGFSVLRVVGTEAFGYSRTAEIIRRLSKNSYVLDKLLNNITLGRYANTLNILCRKGR